MSLPRISKMQQRVLDAANPGTKPSPFSVEVVGSIPTVPAQEVDVAATLTEGLSLTTEQAAALNSADDIGSLNSLEEIFEKLDAQGAIPHEQNDIWDQARQFHDSSVAHIASVNHELAQHLKNRLDDPALRAKIKDKDRLARLVTQLDADTTTCLKGLDDVFEQHKDRTGSTTGPNDHIESLRINEEYGRVMDVFSTTALPMVSEIHELTGLTAEALEAMTQAAHRNAQQDVNVVSDATIIEKPAQ